MENSLIGDDLELIKVKKKISQGVAVLLVREFFLKIFAFAGQIILARILFPADFGVIAIIAFIVNFFGLFLDVGLSPAIIREKNKPTQKQLSTIFFVKLILSLIFVSILVLFSSLIGSVINGFDSENILMIKVYALSLFFVTIKSVPIALIERELKFNIISTIDVLGIIAYQIAVVLFAISGMGVWSFIFAIYIKEIVETVVIFKLCPWRPSLFFQVKKIKKFLNFGIYMQGGGLLNFAQTSVIPFLGGIKTNPYQVGLLDWAFGNALVPETITNNFGRVAYSGFGKIHKNKIALSNTISKSIKILSIINLFFVLAILGFGREGVEILFTSKWLPGIYALYWFAAAMIFTPFISVYAQGILAVGNSKGYFKLNLIATIIEWVSAVYLLLKFGFVGIAMSFFIFSLILSLFSYYLAKKENISGSIIKNLIPIIVIIPVSLITADLLNQLISFSLIGLITKLIIFSFVYLMLIVLVANEEMQSVIKVIKENYLPKII